MDVASKLQSRLSNLGLPGNDADNLELPRNYGFTAWTGRPAAASANTNPGTGVLILTKLYIPRAISVTNLTVYVVTGGTLTAGDNFVGLYSSAGVLIATSADQSTPWTGTGAKVAALTGGPFALNTGNAEDFWVWAGILSVGTTPFFANETALTPLMNIGLTAATSRSCFTGSALTALPASFTPSGVTQWNHAMFVATS